MKKLIIAAIVFMIVVSIAVYNDKPAPAKRQQVSDRFKIVEDCGYFASDMNAIIVRDRQTGVLYTVLAVSQGVSITPLLDSDGKVMVDAR